jgi:hypothetical protein
MSLFSPRESLVSDIQAGDGNIEKLFLRCIVHLQYARYTISIYFQWHFETEVCALATSNYKKVQETHKLFTGITILIPFIIVTRLLSSSSRIFQRSVFTVYITGLESGAKWVSLGLLKFYYLFFPASPAFTLVGSLKSGELPFRIDG